MSITLPRISPSISQQFSLKSRFTNFDLESLTDEELVQQVNALKQDIKVLSTENEILEKSMARLDPSLLLGIEEKMAFIKKIYLREGSALGQTTPSKTSVPGLMTTSRSLSRRVESTTSAKFSETGLITTSAKINILERSELASKEMEMLTLQLNRIKNKARKKEAILKAKFEEITIRVSDIEKAVDTFQENVLTKGWDKISQRIPAEVWTHFMTEWNKATDKQIGKLRLRNSTYNMQCIKLKDDIKKKAELRHNITSVDFEMVRIKNKQHMKAIEEKKHQMVELKKTTGEANLILSINKQKMLQQNLYLTKVLNLIEEKKIMTEKCDKERDKIEFQAKVLEKNLDDVRSMNYEVPNVMDYVQTKADINDLKIAIKRLEDRQRLLKVVLHKHS